MLSDHTFADRERVKDAEPGLVCSVCSTGSAHRADLQRLLVSDVAVMSSSGPRYQAQRGKIKPWVPEHKEHDQINS